MGKAPYQSLKDHVELQPSARELLAKVPRPYTANKGRQAAPKHYAHNFRNAAKRKNQKCRFSAREMWGYSWE
jgi:hypothetical protein